MNVPEGRDGIPARGPVGIAGPVGIDGVDGDGPDRTGDAVLAGAGVGAGAGLLTGVVALVVSTAVRVGAAPHSGLVCRSLPNVLPPRPEYDPRADET